MRRVRIIPVLLIDLRRSRQTVKFGNRAYIGDPINAVRIFNDKGVDELICSTSTRRAKAVSPTTP